MVVEEVLLSIALSSLPIRRYLVLLFAVTSKLVTLTVELLANQAKPLVTPVAATRAKAIIPPMMVFFFPFDMLIVNLFSTDVDFNQHTHMDTRIS